MTETKKTLAILKARWPEVFLIVGFYTLGVGISIPLMPADSDSTLMNTLGCFCVLFFLSLYIISIILTLGFLRTVHLEGSKKHTLTDLLMTGKHFFWRMVGFCLIYVILYFILNRIILFTIIRNFTSIDSGLWKLAKSDPLLYALNVSFTYLILMKLALLMPAIIIVQDCRVSDTLDFLKKCKLSESKELVLLYFIKLIPLFVWALLKISYYPETTFPSVLRVGITAINHVLRFIIAVMAVRFVGSLNLVYDSSMKDSSSEDMFEIPKED